MEGQLPAPGVELPAPCSGPLNADCWLFLAIILLLRHFMLFGSVELEAASVRSCKRRNPRMGCFAVDLWGELDSLCAYYMLAVLLSVLQRCMVRGLLGLSGLLRPACASGVAGSCARLFLPGALRRRRAVCVHPY